MNPLPQSLQVLTLLIDIFLNLFLNQLRQHSYIKFQTFHVCLIHTWNKSILLYLHHMCFKSVKTCENSIQLGFCRHCLSFFIQILKYLSGLPYHNLWFLSVNNIFCSCRIYYYYVHHIIDIFLKVNIICICLDNLLYNIIILGR